MDYAVHLVDILTHYILDNLFSQGTISANEVAVSFEPTTQEVVTNGELTFGMVMPKSFVRLIYSNSDRWN